MPRIHLTDIYVRNLKPSGIQTTYWDTAGGVRGFNVRVSQRGTKTFTLVLGENRKRVTIGRYPTVSLQTARKKAAQLFAEHTLNPHSTTMSFSEAVDLFVTKHCRQNNKPSTARETERVLRRHFWELDTRRLDAITVKDVTDIIDSLLETPAEANHAFVALKTFFNWCLRRDYVQKHPLLALRKPAKVVARDRVLADDEIVAVIQTAGSATIPFDQIVMLLLLTGQRRSEICGLRWSYIDMPARLITFPAAVTKNSRQHRIPLGELAAQIIQTVPNINEYLFPSPSDPSRHFNNYTLTKNNFDERCGIPHWTLHDLRRTFATTLAALRVPPHVTERLLNHSTGAISGVAAIYNRYQYMDEMSEAVSKYEAHLAHLLRGGDNRHSASLV
jgi:integrase